MKNTIKIISLILLTLSISAFTIFGNGEKSKKFINMEEYGTKNKEYITHKLNIREFDKVFARGIKYTKSSIILPKGIYQVRAISKIVTRGFVEKPMPGYAMLMKKTDKPIMSDKLLTGSVTNSQFNTASHINGIIKIDEETEVALYQQTLVPKGEKAYLQITGNGSTNHIFASIVITEL